MVGFCRARNVVEMDEIYLPLINLFYPVNHLFAEVKKVCFEFQGFVSFRPHFNSFGDGMPRSSPKVDIFGRELDRYPDKGPDSQCLKFMAWIIGIDPGPFAEPTLVTPGIYL